MNEIWGGLIFGGGEGYYWNFTVCSVCSVSGEMSRGRERPDKVPVVSV